MGNAVNGKVLYILVDNLKNFKKTSLFKTFLVPRCKKLFPRLMIVTKRKIVKYQKALNKIKVIKLGKTHLEHNINSFSTF